MQLGNKQLITLLALFISSTLMATDYSIVIDKYMVLPDSDWLLTLSDEQSNIIHQEKIGYHTSLGPYEFTFEDLPPNNIHLTLSKIAQGRFRRTKPTEMHLFFYNIPTEFYVKNSPDSITGFIVPPEKRKRTSNNAFSLSWKASNFLQLHHLPQNTLLKTKFTLQYSDRLAVWSIIGMVDQDNILLPLPKVSSIKTAEFEPINPLDGPTNPIRIAVNHILISERDYVRKHPYELGIAWFLKMNSVEESKWDAWKWE